MGPELPKSPAAWEISTRRAPCGQTRWRQGEEILDGLGVVLSPNHQLPRCTSKAQIGYFHGRYRPANFLATSGVPTALESMSKRARVGAELSKLPTFWEISTRRTPMWSETVASKRYDISRKGAIPLINQKLHHCKCTAQIVYWVGRFRAPNFLAAPNVPTALECMAKMVRSMARTSQISYFLGNTHAAGPHVVRYGGAKEKRYWLEGRRSIGESETPPVYIYGPYRLLKRSISGTELSGDSYCAPALASISKMVRFGARNSRIPNFRENIHAADPHVGRNGGVQGWDILPGRGAAPLTNQQLPRCTNTAHIVYLNGRFRAPTFLAIPTIPRP